MISMSTKKWLSVPASFKRTVNNKKQVLINSEWKDISISKVDISPIIGEKSINKPWEGNLTKKPWEYEVTAVIPCLNTFETLEICIELLQLQTTVPYIMIIDTGSFDEELNKVLKLRDKNVEVHSIALNGVRHPSDYPAMAMDMAFTLCRSPYLFATHADVFIRRKDLVESLLDLCKTQSPAVGYELSPRAHADWEGMVSHTASMYDMKVMDKINFAWSLRKLCNKFEIVDYSPDPMKPNWPDTEILGNYILRENNIKPHLIGKEDNQVRTLDDNIDHFRSYTAAKMYSPGYFKTTKSWFEDARIQALERIKDWGGNLKPTYLPSNSLFM